MANVTQADIAVDATDMTVHLINNIGPGMGQRAPLPRETMPRALLHPHLPITSMLLREVIRKTHAGG